MTAYSTEDVARRIDDMKRDVDARFDTFPEKYATKDSVKKIETELAKKISVFWFMAFVVSMFGFMAGFAYFTWSDNKEFKKDLMVRLEILSATSQETRESVAELNGKLEPFDFVIEN